MSAQTSYILLYVGWTILFLSQRTVPTTILHLQTTESFSLEDIGRLLSCFGITYALTKLASGFLYDSLHLNPKLFFCLGLGVGGVLVFLFPLAAGTSVSLACLVWLGAGLFHGLGWPACARMIKQWYTPSNIGKRYMLLSAASNIASALAPILSAYTTSLLDWQCIYYIVGTCCLVTTITLVVGIEISPEKSVVQNGTVTRSEVHSWYGVFLFKEFWFVTMLSASVWTVKASIQDWVQLYMTQQLHFSRETAAQCGSMSEVGAIVAKLSLGIMSDYLLKKKMLVRQGLCPRAPLLLVLAVPVAISTHLYAYNITPDSSHLWLMMVLFGLGFSTGGILGVCSLSLMESVPDALSATALGIGDCTTHLVGRSLLGYIVFSGVVNHPEWGWSTGYRMIAAVGLNTAVTALLLVMARPSSKDSRKEK